VRGLAGGPGGALWQRKIPTVPSGTYTTLYFSCDDVESSLKVALALGASLETPKTLIAEGMGHFAQFVDTEGNIVSLWAKG
jgi:predicted enzyme related to lactoylglutathione lyase